MIRMLQLTTGKSKHSIRKRWKKSYCCKLRYPIGSEQLLQYQVDDASLSKTMDGHQGLSV